MLKIDNLYPPYTVYFQPHDIDRILPQLQDGELDYYHLYLHGMRHPIAISIHQLARIEPFLAPGAFDLTESIDRPASILLTELAIEIFNHELANDVNPA